MSELYLVLRSRLDAVTNWISLGAEVMRKARKAKGLSYEAVARLASVSSKTYERYEKLGRVPEHMVETFADILGLEIERPGRARITVDPRSSVEEQMAALQGEVAEVREMVAELLGRGA